MGEVYAVYDEWKAGLQEGVGMGTLKEAQPGKGSGKTKRSKSYGSKEGWNRFDESEGGCRPPDSYLKGWQEYTDEFVCTEPDFQSLLQQEQEREYEIGDI